MPNKRLQDNSDSPFVWDPFSDQPYPIQDAAYKRKMRWLALPEIVLMILVSLIALPFVLLRFVFFQKPKPSVGLDEKIGLCVNADKDATITEELVKELNVKRLSIRIPLSDVENLDMYFKFAERFAGYDIHFVLLQSRQHIENHSMLEADLETVFSRLSGLSKCFQIGNAVNRSKWGFRSVDEYLKFFRIAQHLKDSRFPDLCLFGSSIIDFELYAILRSLFHFKRTHYDGVSSLLYVDRRGGPEGRQFGFDLPGKIKFIQSAMNLSWNTESRLRISETNWPIKDTQPYAPALGDVWVDERKYAEYLLRYYALAMASSGLECIYWHQLLAPGYGLVDTREGARKRRAFYVYKFLLSMMQGASVISLDNSDGFYSMAFLSSTGSVFSLYWSVSGVKVISVLPDIEVRDAAGELIEVRGNEISVETEPVYFLSISEP